MGKGRGVGGGEGGGGGGTSISHVKVSVVAGGRKKVGEIGVFLHTPQLGENLHTADADADADAGTGCYYSGGRGGASIACIVHAGKLRRREGESKKGEN